MERKKGFVGEVTQTGDIAGNGGNLPEYSVSELSFAVKRTMEETFAYVRVRGEVGRVSRPGSGHIYLDLKDEKAVIAGVIWKGQAARMRVPPEQGMEVVVTGRLTTYPGQSKYQIVIERLEPAGVGALMALLEERKKKLAAEGLFSDERKKPLPFIPRIIGIVTSPTGAVIRDMLHGFDERFPTHVIVWPVRVQGESCAKEVAAAIHGFNALRVDSPALRPDVVIVARGGGSLEDLWGFNEEIVARAAAASAIPVISAVGHETDWTLIDHVADARAPTPTKAAEWAVPMQSELLVRNGELGGRLALAMRRRLEDGRSRLRAGARGLPRLADLLALPRQRFDGASGRLDNALRHFAQAKRTRLAGQAGRLSRRLLTDRIARSRDALNAAARRGRRALPVLLERSHARLEAKAKLLAALGYQGVLARGFAVVRGEAGAMLRSAGAVRPGAGLDIEFADGHVAVHADGGGFRPKGAKHRRKSPDDNQGSLF